MSKQQRTKQQQQQGCFKVTERLLYIASVI